MLHCTQAESRNVEPTDDIARLDAAVPLRTDRFGARAARLATLVRAGAPVPEGVAVGFQAASRLRTDAVVARAVLTAAGPLFDHGNLLIVRASPEEPKWGGPTSVRNVGFCLSRIETIARRIGSDAAEAGFLTAIRDYAGAVAGLDTEEFEGLLVPGRTARGGRAGVGEVVTGTATGRIMHALEVFRKETDSEFPDDPLAQLREILGSMSKSWNRPSARILRQAGGAPEEAGLGFVIQRQVSVAGRGQIQGVDPETGCRRIVGRHEGPDRKAAVAPMSSAGLEGIGRASRAVLDMALKAGDRCLGDASQLVFATDGDGVHILDLVAALRQENANLQILVDLVGDGILTREQAVLKADPRTITAHLHPRIAPGQSRDAICRGIAASQGAGQGPIYFSAEAVQAAASRDTPAILVRAETQPEDIRGMSTAAGVLTLSGGLTSHAAVIAQGLGVPCVVGASELRIDHEERCLVAPGGRRIEEGETLTIDGATGLVLHGDLKLVRSEVPEAFHTMMDWADDMREIGVRANADTLAEARSALRFGVDGIGLCRTEHMFYEGDRINVMREMILASDLDHRTAALERLLPMQRDDFASLFELMDGLPVTIRLLDPPLHEFLPNESSDVADLARSMQMPQNVIRRRIEEMAEFNPMLGKRGVRLAVTMPEIYEMQARAIFEAAIEAERRIGNPVTPQIMIPLVSAHREVELVKARIDAVSRLVQAETGVQPRYKLGVMVETPRAALRAGDLATATEFLSFGTNDLTQMTYGLSRDDSGRFMREYVNERVFPEDPFMTLDLEGVGELMLTAARRGRHANPGITLSLCGEHGGDPASVRFCHVAGFDYVSCSPFRVPIARLAAAQAKLLSAQEGDTAADPTRPESNR